MPRPSGRGFALLGLAAGTYLAGRVVGTWELYLFAFAFLAAVIVSWVLVLATGRRIRVTRSLTPERPVAGDEPEFSFVVKNASLLPGPQLTLRSALVGFSADNIELEVESLTPRREKALKTRTRRVNRGVHLLPPAEAVAEDPLGIAVVVHKVSDPLPVIVYPRVAFLDSCVLYPDIGLRHHLSGQHGLLVPGASEFRSIRPHQPGEPLSHIDWKSTAKTGTLMLREMDEPAGADITMLLDGTAEQLAGRPPDSNFELAVRVAGSVADFALRAGRGVTLLRHERNWRQLRLTADGGGRRSLLETLAQAQPNALAPLVNALRHLRTSGPHLLRAQSVTLVSISLDHGLARTLIGLREDGVRLSFLYVSGGSFAGEATGTASSLLPFLPPRDTGGAARDATGPLDLASTGAPAAAAAGATLPTEARALLLSLASAGIPCLTLNHGDDLVRTLSLWRAGHRSRAAG
jgi:uncharacterized protein (DUF58 family)